MATTPAQPVPWHLVLLRALAAGVGDSLLFVLVVILPLIWFASDQFFIVGGVVYLLYLLAGVPFYIFAAWQLHEFLGLQARMVAAWFVVIMNVVVGYGATTRISQVSLRFVWVYMAIFGASIGYVLLQELFARAVKNRWLRIGFALGLVVAVMMIVHTFPMPRGDN